MTERPSESQPHHPMADSNCFCNSSKFSSMAEQEREIKTRVLVGGLINLSFEMKLQFNSTHNSIFPIVLRFSPTRKTGKGGWN